MVYQQIPDAGPGHFETLWKAKRTDFEVPLTMSGGSHGGAYILRLDKDIFATLVSENENTFSEGMDS